MNFKKNVVPPTKKPLFSGYGNDYDVQAPKKSVSLLTLIIVVVLTFVFAFVLFKNYDRITNWFASSIETTSVFHLGQDVELSGNLQSDGDLISYTHTLMLNDGMVIGLKSRVVDLNAYSGNVIVQWVVEKELNEMIILEVATISWDLLVIDDEEDVVWLDSWTYIASAGMYFPDDFFSTYTLLNRWENGVVRIQHIATNHIIPVSYFVCKSSDPNKNCSQLQKNISASAEKSISTSYGVTAYKLEWLTSWYFSNGNYFGYFINDVGDQDIIDVLNTFVLPTEYYVKNSLLSKIQSLCTDDNSFMMQISSQSFAVDTNWFVVTLQWPTTDGSASCKLFINPALSAWATKISYITSTTNPVATTTDTSSFVSTTTTSLTDIDTSVKQFPINLEKTLTFISSRGYSIVFPSSNIAYEAVNISDDLGLPGVRCTSQMNITKFADKETMHEDPKVSVFVCTVKWTLNNIWNTMIQKESENWTKFIIQIVDSARYEFANNISIN